jgi:hypothetical protein
VSNDEGLGFPIKTQEAGEVPATFSFRFTEDALYVTGTAPIGQDQALIIADVMGECFGAQMLEAAAAFAVEQEGGPASALADAGRSVRYILEAYSKASRSRRTPVQRHAHRPSG